MVNIHFNNYTSDLSHLAKEILVFETCCNHQCQTDFSETQQRLESITRRIKNIAVLYTDLLPELLQMDRAIALQALFLKQAGNAPGVSAILTALEENPDTTLSGIESLAWDEQAAEDREARQLLSI